MGGFIGCGNVGVYLEFNVWVDFEVVVVVFVFGLFLMMVGLNILY